MGAYYNEFDPGAAAWLRELIKRGLIADGEVDERSILDVSADELRGFIQCHFFAGIGGWSHALRLAGWPDDRPVWTGSPPCQPFSSAGKQLGRDDARHLAPHFIGLVRAARPAVLFGEQVASADVFGKAAGKPGKGFANPPQWAWLDDLSDRLEAARYAIGASDIPAASIGAPHIRQRTFFGAVRLANSDNHGQWEHREPMGSPEGAGKRKVGERERVWPDLANGSTVDRLANASGDGSPATNAPNGFWRDADWLFCRDAKWRPVERGLKPLVDGLPRGMGRGSDDGSPFHPAEARVMRLRGYGNAIVPQVAAVFISAFASVLD